MNIFEIKERFNIQLPKLKRMQRDGILICDEGEGHPLAPAMRANLAKKQPLSVEQLLVLHQNPRVFAELRGRQRDARDQIKALGDFVADRPVSAMLGHFHKAAENDQASVAIVIRWLKSVTPDHDVYHAWYAVRIAQYVKIADALPEFTAKVNRALKKCRAHPDFADWVRTETVGAHKRTVYARPDVEKLPKNWDL